MRVQSALQGSNLVIRLENAGDEDARNVAAVVDFMGQRSEFPPLEALPPNSPRGALFPVVLEKLNGTYPAVITVGFEDLNGYPFSSVTVVPVRGAVGAFTDVVAAVKAVKIRGKGKVHVKFRSSSTSPVDGRYRLITAREIICDENEGQVSIPARGKAELSIPVENFSALPGATYPVHIILEYDREGTHQTVVAAGMATIYTASVWKSGLFWIVLMIVVLIVAGSFVFTRKQEGKESSR